MRSKFPAELLWQCSYAGNFIQKKRQSIVYIAWLGWFVFCWIYFTSYHAGRLRQYKASASIIHKVHSDAGSNCHRQQHTLTWRRCSDAVRKKKCVMLLLVTENFPAIHFSHFPQTVTRHAWNLCRVPWYEMGLYFNVTVRLFTVIHVLLGVTIAVWPDFKISEYQIWSWLKCRRRNSD